MKKKPTLKSLKAKCWKLFSELIRRGSADEGGTVQCFTCSDLMFWKESQAGHAIGGRNNAVLLDSEIVRPQCVRCNVFMRGNYPIFAAKLIRENGLEWFEAKLEASRKVLKYTRSDYENMVEYFKKRLEELA